MVKSLFYSVSFHALMILITFLTLPFMLREPIDLPPIVSVELIQISDKTNIPFAPKARKIIEESKNCLLYTSPSPRDGLLSRMPSSA